MLVFSFPWTTTDGVASGIVIAQRQAQLVEWTTELAMSSIGHVVEMMRQAHGVAEATITKVTFVQSQVEGRIVVIVENAKANMLHPIGEISHSWNTVSKRLHQTPSL